MKYIKLYEKCKFIKGDYVKVIDKDDNDYGKIFRVFDIDENKRDVWADRQDRHMIFLIDERGKELGWVYSKNLKKSSEFEFDAQKYNL